MNIAALFTRTAAARPEGSARSTPRPSLSAKLAPITIATPAEFTRSAP